MPFDEWMKILLHCEDGRFTEDKMWCFVALNVSLHIKDNDQGAFFINSFFENGPETLEDLQSELKKATMNGLTD